MCAPCLEPPYNRATTRMSFMMIFMHFILYSIMFLYGNNLLMKFFFPSISLFFYKTFVLYLNLPFILFCFFSSVSSISRMIPADKTRNKSINVYLSTIQYLGISNNSYRTHNSVFTETCILYYLCTWWFTQ